MKCVQLKRPTMTHWLKKFKSYKVPEDDAPSVETRRTIMFNIFNL
jgi:hypothetical protein